MLRSCYLNIVQMGASQWNEGPDPPGPTSKERTMSFRMNRVLDVVVTYAVLGLTLAVAGATAVLGA